MPIKHKGITPVFEVDTRPLQNTVAVAGTKWRKGPDGSLVATTGNEGICATLVSFWLSKRAEGTMVTSIDQFPNRMALSIAQSAYEIGGTRESLADVYGLQKNVGVDLKRKWYMWKKTRVEEVAAAAVTWLGYYYISIRGDGGHALGMVTKGTPQFLDPNLGILTFANNDDMRKWVPAHCTDWYPDLMKEVGIYGYGL